MSVVDDQVMRIQMNLRGRTCDLVLEVVGAPVEISDADLYDAADYAATLLEVRDEATLKAHETLSE